VAYDVVPCHDVALGYYVHEAMHWAVGLKLLYATSVNLSNLRESVL